LRQRVEGGGFACGVIAASDAGSRCDDARGRFVPPETAGVVYAYCRSSARLHMGFDTGQRLDSSVLTISPNLRKNSLRDLARIWLNIFWPRTSVNASETFMLVCSMQMPGVDSMDLLRQMHARRPDVPVVMLAGDPAYFLR
jgi:CheY-like chemotaxis protein